MCGAGFSNFHETNIHVLNNVFASNRYPFSVQAAGQQNDLIQHNVMVEQIDYETQNGNAPSGNIAKDNVFVYAPGITLNGQSGSCGCTATFNLNPGATWFGTGSVNGAPVFVSSPASGYYHYQLAPSSPGYHAASDGKSMGIAP